MAAARITTRHHLPSTSPTSSSVGITCSVSAAMRAQPSDVPRAYASDPSGSADRVPCACTWKGERGASRAGRVASVGGFMASEALVAGGD